MQKLTKCAGCKTAQAEFEVIFRDYPTEYLCDKCVTEVRDEALANFIVEPMCPHFAPPRTRSTCSLCAEVK